MATIQTKVKGYNGVSASVRFVNGIGYTDDPHLIEWFKKHGYTVLDEEPVEKGQEEAIEESEEESEEEPEKKPEKSKGKQNGKSKE